MLSRTRVSEDNVFTLRGSFKQFTVILISLQMEKVYKSIMF